MTYIYIIVLVLINAFLLILWIYLKCFSQPSSSAIPLNIPQARANAKRCTCITLKQQTKNLQKICLRIVYSLDPADVEEFQKSISKSKKDVKIVFYFTNRKDKRMFKCSMLAKWLFDVESVNDIDLAGIFLAVDEPYYQLYRLSKRQYMFKITFMLDNCLNYFDDLVLKSDYAFSLSQSLHKRRSSNDTTDLNEFRTNPRKVRKVFIQVSGEVKRRRSSRQSPKVFSDDDPLRSIRINQYWLELAKKVRDTTRTRSIATELSHTDTFFCATMYSTTLSRIGIFYELIKCTFSAENNHFPDMVCRLTTVKLTFAECITFLIMDSGLLAVGSVLIVRAWAPNIMKGLFIYSMAAVVSCLAVSCFHMLVIYAFKCSIQTWMSLKPKDSHRRRSKFTLCVVIAGLGAVFTTGIFILALDVQLQSIWLYAYLLSLSLFLLTGLYMWLFLADLFQYFDIYQQNDFSSKRKYRKAFENMVVAELLAAPEEQNSLSGDM